jgi:iron complex outermembrane receptor protein
VTIPLPKNFSLFGGVRYTYDRKATKNYVGTAFGPPIDFCGANNSFLDNFHNILYRVGMGWEPTEQLNVYLKYSRGYNAGGVYYNGCNNPYKPEHLGTIEGGVKGRFFDGKLVFDADGYWNHFTDFQTYKNLETSSLVVNAPEAEMWGGEFQATALPTENIQADASLSIMHSQYDIFSDFDPLNTYNPRTGAANPHINENLAGHQMERAPNKTLNVGLQYDWPVPWNSVIGDRAQSFLNLGSLRLRGEWYWSDYVIYRYYDLGPRGSNFNRQNPYSIFNFYATLPTEDNKWSLRVYAKNFTSTKYLDYTTATPWGQIYGVGGMPQWFGADLTYRF